MLLRFLTLWSFNFKKFLSLIIKLLHLVFQVSIPCKKRTYRLFGKEGYPLVDIMTGENEPPPKVKKKSKKAPWKICFVLKVFWIFFFSGFSRLVRGCFAVIHSMNRKGLMWCHNVWKSFLNVTGVEMQVITPDFSISLLCWQNANDSHSHYVCEGEAREELEPLKEIRSRCIKQLENMRPDHMRRLNPTPYKVIKHKHHELREPVFFFFFGIQREK